MLSTNENKTKTYERKYSTSTDVQISEKQLTLLYLINNEPLDMMTDNVNKYYYDEVQVSYIICRNNSIIL